MFNSFQLRKALSHLRNFVQFSKDYLADSYNQLHKFIITISLLSRKSFKNFLVKRFITPRDNFYIIPTFSESVNNFFADLLKTPVLSKRQL